MHRNPGPFLLLTLPLLLGISPLVVADEAADRAALEATAQAWIASFNARDVDATAALMTEDVVLLDPNIAPVRGRQAARKAWAAAMRAAKGRLTTATKELVIAGDVAWRIGTFAQEPRDSGLLGPGQSLEIWKRENGQWKLHRQMSSNLLTAPRLVRPVPSEPVLDKPTN